MPESISRVRTGRPPATSRAEILAAAQRVIDRDGWDRLTIRRLATELGVGTTTLYHHVRDREDLLILLLNDHADELLRVRLPRAPRRRIIVGATAIHDALAAWPWAAEVLTTDGFLARIGPSALVMVEAIVAGAIGCGTTPDQAAMVFRSIWYYTVGEILVRAHSADGAGARGVSFADFDPTAFAALAAIGERWPELAARDTFADGLEIFVDGLLRRFGTATP